MGLYIDDEVRAKARLYSNLVKATFVMKNGMERTRTIEVEVVFYAFFIHSDLQNDSFIPPTMI